MVRIPTKKALLHILLLCYISIQFGQAPLDIPRDHAIHTPPVQNQEQLHHERNQIQKIRKILSKFCPNGFENQMGGPFIPFDTLRAAFYPF